MTNNQELYQQILKSLQENDQITLNIVLQDQQRSLIDELLERIQDPILKTRFSDYLAKWNSLNEQRKLKLESQDKIRQINVALSKEESEQDILQEQIKRKKLVKIQQRPGYAFYGNVKCLMRAYGDIAPVQQSIKMMHSQVHILFQLVFKFISQLEEVEKKSENALRKIFEIVFKQQCQCFQKIVKQYKKATKSTKKKEEVYEQSSEQDDDFPDEKQQITSSSHMNANTFEQSKYLANLTKNMNEEQYESYSQCRSVNFLQNNNNKKNIQDLNKFIKYLDPGLTILKPNMRILELISFICCRFIRKIIFEINRMKNGGVLKPLTQPLTSDQIKNIGNKLLENYQNQFQQIRSSKERANNLVKSSFISDFDNPEFKALLPKKYTSASKSGQQIWEECPHYRQMWMQRYKGETEVRDRMAQIEKEQFQPVTEYAKFIVKNLDIYNKKGAQFLWRKYFSQQKITRDQNQQQITGRPRKRVKLQSLK